MTCNSFGASRIAVPTRQMDNLRSEPATSRAATSSLTECAAWRGCALILAFWDPDNLMRSEGCACSRDSFPCARLAQIKA